MKKVKLVVMITIMALALTGCGSASIEEELAKEKQNNASLSDMLLQNDLKIKELEDTLKAVTGKDNTQELTSISDGKLGKQFNSLDDSIIFKVPFKYTGETDAPNTSSINISKNVNMVPSGNWIISIKGSSTEFYHPNNISGVIKVGKIQQGTLDKELFKTTILDPFIVEVPSKNIQYRSLFLEGTAWGQYANIETTANNSDATLRVGAIGIGETSVSFIFFYNNLKDSVNEELIDNIIKTMKINGQNVTFD